MPWLIECIFPRRLHRLAYFLRGMATNILASVLYASSTLVEPRYWWSLLVLLAGYQFLFIILPRVRDIGISAWWLLLMFAPIADLVLGIILLFRAPMMLARPGPDQRALGARRP